MVEIGVECMKILTIRRDPGNFGQFARIVDPLRNALAGITRRVDDGRKLTNDRAETRCTHVCGPHMERMGVWESHAVDRSGCEFRDNFKSLLPEAEHVCQLELLDQIS